MEPWGYHLTIHLYGEGREPLSEEAIRAGEAAGKALRLAGHPTVYVGVQQAVLQDEPWDQRAT